MTNELLTVACLIVVIANIVYMTGHRSIVEGINIFNQWIINHKYYFSQNELINRIFAILRIVTFVYVLVRFHDFLEVIQHLFSVAFDIPIIENSSLIKMYNYREEIRQKQSLIQFGMITSFALFIPFFLTIYSNFKRDLFTIYEKVTGLLKEKNGFESEYEMQLQRIDDHSNNFNASYFPRLKSIARFSIVYYILSIVPFFVVSNAGINQQITNFEPLNFQDSLQLHMKNIKYVVSGEHKNNSFLQKYRVDSSRILEEIDSQYQVDHVGKIASINERSKLHLAMLNVSWTFLQVFILHGLSIFLFLLIFLSSFYSKCYGWKGEIPKSKRVKLIKPAIIFKKSRFSIPEWLKSIVIFKFINPFAFAILFKLLVDFSKATNDNFSDEMETFGILFFLGFGMFSSLVYQLFRSPFTNLLFLASFLLMDNFFDKNHSVGTIRSGFLIGLSLDIIYLIASTFLSRRKLGLNIFVFVCSTVVFFGIQYLGNYSFFQGSFTPSLNNLLAVSLLYSLMLVAGQFLVKKILRKYMKLEYRNVFLSKEVD